MTDATATTTPRSPRTIAVDNFLRRALRVGDPRDPAQVAAALLSRYPEEAERERRERSGLAYSALSIAVPAAAGGGAALAELAQARDDLERDAQALLACSQLKDIRIELTGWSRASRRIADDGLAAARLALDAVQFDRALAARGQLGNYARLARYVGALSDGAGGDFRRFGQSCDSLAALILVAIGEGLAASGITRSTALVRVASSELQQRRNAVINALRSLTGSVESPGGQEEWPRGIEAYRRLAGRLAATGQSDLRVLLEETGLAAAMDELVDLSAGGKVANLRELSTASPLVIDRFQRLVQIARTIPATAEDVAGAPFIDSPPLASFTSAVQLFVDAFVGTGGSRLLYIARPPILIRGLYGVAGPDEGARRLLDLTLLRGRLAEQIDCFAGCDCDADSLRCQILLDFLLHGLDRAIDSYAVGTDPRGRGDPERRTTVFGVLIEAAVTAAIDPGCDFDADLHSTLLEGAGHLLDPFATPKSKPRVYPDEVHAVMRQELQLAYRSEEDVERLARALSPSCHAAELFEAFDGESLVRNLIRTIYEVRYGDIRRTVGLDIPPTPDTALGIMIGLSGPDQE